MRNLLLDTHVWIWLSIEAEERLSQTAKRLLVETRQKWISAISCWELAKLVEKGRISFSIPTVAWIKRSLSEFEMRLAELSPEVAVASTLLSDFYQDPADQIIVATSNTLKIPLLTSDRRILNFPHVEALW